MPIKPLTWTEHPKPATKNKKQEGMTREQVFAYFGLDEEEMDRNNPANKPQTTPSLEKNPTDVPIAKVSTDDGKTWKTVFGQLSTNTVILSGHANSG